VEYRILGPLEVTGAEGDVPFNAPKQRALLGVLLLHPNEVVPSERLIDELWGEHPPQTAAQAVQTYVSQLRRALGAEVIVTRPPGYLLQVEEEAVDASRFRRLTGEARLLAADDEHEQADVLYRQALALWRGPPLADVVFESFAGNEVERLEQERLDALISRIDCELALGQHEALVAELETLVRHYPLRERLRAQLMLALYRSGRQADALAAYQDARRTLVEELGLEPSRELQELEQAILNHDPALQPPPLAAATRPVDRRRRRWRALAIAALVALGLTLGLTLSLDQAPPASIRLEANSIGFIDAKSDRVTKSYPVGRQPSALTVADNAIWAANYQDETVTRVEHATGHSFAIPVAGHPTSLAAYQGKIWVWTQEGLLVSIDSRYYTVGHPLRLAPASATGREPGRITAARGFLWITVPEATVLRVDPAHPQTPHAIMPDWGAEGPIVRRGEQVWVAGSSSAGYVFPITDPQTGIAVGGPIRDLAPYAGSLWVLSGNPVVELPRPALRAVNLHDQLIRTSVTVGKDPVALAVAAGSIWVANGTDKTISRVDPSRGRPVKTIKLGVNPTAIAADRDGVWVAVS
jgi:DNA-binding SARP family transcriptional activator/DNA-binding beta-propeller fold protein YncE